MILLQTICKTEFHLEFYLTINEFRIIIPDLNLLLT